MMTPLSLAQVESWLDSNPSSMADIFIRKADMELINRWLMTHGFLAIRNLAGSHQESGTGATSDDDSPVEKAAGYFSDGGDSSSGPRKCKNLRQDFARAKSRMVFRTSDQLKANPQSNLHRNSLRDMRKYLSLPSRSIHILSLLIESKVRLPHLHWKGLDSKRELRYANERQFFLEIVQEIANDLDARSLTQKIIENISVLMDADGASLFLVQGGKSRQVLVSKVFDVHCGANIFLPSATDDNEVHVPWGKGIIGYVASSGETVNLTDASEDSRYKDDVDKIIGYKTNTLLCMPVKNADGEIIAVAQVINKSGENGQNIFTKEDEKLFETYLQFCGIALTNAQLFDASRKEYERNRALLEVVHDLFEEQTSLEKVILKIMQRAQRLLKCERASVMLLNDSHEEPKRSKFTKVFDLTSPTVGGHSLQIGPVGWSDAKTSTGILRLAERVAFSGDVLNVVNASQVEPSLGRYVKSLLCMPIRDRDYKIIGVGTIINRTDGQAFDENDEQLFEAFALFCGLGINNTLMYSELAKAMARQKVAIEVISYHATAAPSEVEKVLLADIPEADDIQLTSLKFDDFSLSSEEMILASIRMFRDLGLISRFSIEYKTLCQWLCSVRKNYRNVPYHNWRHAFNVAQVMFATFTHCGLRSTLTDLEMLGMLVGCLCHDLDHRGTNNAFQEKSGSALALLYGNTATMEQHHFNHAVTLLNSQGHNIFSSLSPTNYSAVMKFLKHAILATDLSTYFQHRKTFFALIEEEAYDWSTEDHRDLLRSMLMTACDLGAGTKPWHVQQKVAELVTSEFFDQGDKEKNQLNIQPQALMDRERQHELPDMQYRWLDSVCLPLYTVLAKLNSSFQEMVEGALNNREMWAGLDQRESADQQETEEGQENGDPGDAETT